MKAILIILLFSIFAFNAGAHVRTNVNEVTDLFESNIENKDQEFKDLQKNNDDALDNIRSETGFQFIQGMDKDVNGKISELNSIRDTDLDNAGRDKRYSDEYRFYDEGDFEPDYTKPGNRMHKEDAMTIAIGTRKKLDELLTELNKIGVDCKTVKGPKQKEAQFFIDIHRAEQKNTEYDLFLCEEPRNQYQCDDSVALTCTRKGKGYGDWEDRVIRFNGHAIYNEKMNWGFAVKWKKKRWGWHITPYHPGSSIFGWPDQVDSCWRDNPAAIIADARSYIAAKLQVSVEQIGENVIFPSDNGGRGVEGGNITATGQRHRVVWDEYEFKYQFREAFDTCEEWSEDWTERCNIK